MSTKTRNNNSSSKPNKDTSLLANWRPIRLLNVDYKIATKAIANRLKKVLGKIINNTQTGFIKGRYIGENVRLIFETIEYVKSNKLPGLLLFADFEKAFDSLNHDFMLKCIDHFNFGDSFKRWIKLFYNNVTSMVINNGYMSESFTIKQGVRQGCPLSSTIFILCIEVLSSFIEKDNEIKGIELNGHEVKQTLFADDATFLNNGSQQSFEKLVDVIEQFGNISGLKLNSNKTIVLKIGTLKDTNIKYNTNFKWTSDRAQTLGMTFTNCNEQNKEINIKPKLENFYKCLKQWEHRKLTLMGKITVIKTYALPKLIYPFTVLQNPSEDTLKEITKAMYKFIWDKKPDKIKREVLTSDYESGGLKMIDIKLFLRSLKASWIKRIMDTENKGSWKVFYTLIINKVGGNLIF